MSYHDGEYEVQARTGQFNEAVQSEAAIRPFVPPPLARFLASQRWLLIGGVDADGAVWASVRTGEEGFVQAPDPSTVRVLGPAPDADPLASLTAPAPLALLAIDLGRRFRARVNGRLREDPGPGLVVSVEQAYPNCMKYIQQRHLLPLASPPPSGPAVPGDGLDEPAVTLLAGADTAFLASIAPAGADVSHRGGRPGFLEVLSERTIRFPDYRGNSMFNTFGNLELDSRAGLLVPDFSTGSVLQLSGRAQVDYDPPRLERHPDAARLVTLTIERVLRRPGLLPFSAQEVTYSPFLPTAGK